MAQWIVFTLVFGAMPYGIEVLIGYVRDGTVALHPSGSILFLGMVACASVLENERPRFGRKHRRWLARSRLGVLILVVAGGTFYGLFELAHSDDPVREVGWSCPALLMLHAADVSPPVGGRILAHRGRCVSWRARVERMHTLSLLYAALSVTLAMVFRWVESRRRVPGIGGGG